MLIMGCSRDLLLRKSDLSLECLYDSLSSFSSCTSARGVLVVESFECSFDLDID